MNRVPKRVLGDGDLFIYQNISEVPYFSCPISMDYIIVTFCLEGSAQGKVNMKPVRIVKGDVLVVTSQIAVTYEESSPDFRMVTLLFSPRCQSQFRVLNPIKMKLSLMQSPVLIPKKSSQHFMNLCIQMLLETLLLHNSDNVYEMVKKILDLIAMHLLGGNLANNIKSDGSRMEQVFECFVDELMKHYATSHAVAWYANKLAITPNYLSKCCRKAVCKSALDVICVFLVLEAQRQLQVHPPQPLKTIAANLGFANQSSFSTFFRRQTKQTPAEYRNQ